MTLKDIAREAGVAASTVSLVLNNKKGVHKDTREKVRTILEANGFEIRNTEPLVQEICFVRLYSANHVKERNEDFFIHVLNGAENRARQLDCSLRLMNVSDDALLSTLHGLADSRTAGVVLLASELERELAPSLEDLPLPLVAVDKQLDEFRINTLATSNISGAYQAVKYLYSLGHRRIGLLKGEVNIGGLPERAVGYRRALRDLGLPYEEKYIVTTDVLYSSARQSMIGYLQQAADIPTAFFAENDIIAAGCLRGLQDSGYRVPDDVSLIGFDDLSPSTFTTPQLSTMHNPCADLGSAAVDRILELCKDNKAILKSTLGTVLTLRESTAAPAVTGK